MKPKALFVVHQLTKGPNDFDPFNVSKTKRQSYKQALSTKRASHWQICGCAVASALDSGSGCEHWQEFTDIY